jgi:nicotinate-nucleotide pyrophosphorylase (carboxylating)
MQGITPETLSSFFSPHVDVLSMGKLTQGYPTVDLSFKLPKA